MQAVSKPPSGVSRLQALEGRDLGVSRLQAPRSLWRSMFWNENNKWCDFGKEENRWENKTWAKHNTWGEKTWEDKGDKTWGGKGDKTKTGAPSKHDWNGGEEQRMWTASSRRISRRLAAAEAVQSK